MRYYLHHIYHRGYLMNSNQFIANEQGVQNIYTADEKQKFVQQAQSWQQQAHIQAA
ncbi:hypothetical protein QDY72_05460 [Kingella negevensis]|uniref:hypothetical protein n=1 Tax=Kingella negevensis TaxID=1522312 RepID=UPI00254B4857|nr:hypothetical protein [Kingella negevensis]MDK4684628.1 hypothetical protein [Kingella negevensis]